MAFRKNFGEFLAENNNNDESLSEASEHEGWLVIGFDKKSKKAEVLSIPLIRKEAVRFLQSFEAQMDKLADHMQKYTKLKLEPASEVFESDTIVFEEIEYNLNESSDEDKPYFDFLLALRDSGATNMFGAAPYLQQTFGMSKSEATKILKKWMKSFSESVTEARKRSSRIGTYKAKDGRTYPKFRDDENYTYIEVMDNPVMIDYNGEQDNPSAKEIQKDIDDAKKQGYPMSDKEYREAMMAASGRY